MNVSVRIGGQAEREFVFDDLKICFRRCVVAQKPSLG